MMITSAAHSTWPLDVQLENWRQSGLRKPCVARMKLFTLDNGLIIERAGQLTEEDREKVAEALRMGTPV